MSLSGSNIVMRKLAQSPAFRGEQDQPCRACRGEERTAAPAAALAGSGTTFTRRVIDPIRAKDLAQPATVFEALSNAGQEAPGRAAGRSIQAQDIAAWRAQACAGHGRESRPAEPEGSPYFAASTLTARASV